MSKQKPNNKQNNIDQRWNQNSNVEDPIIRVKNLKKYYDNEPSLLDQIFNNESAPVKAVDDVSLKLDRGESVGIVGESGCGKSTLARTLVGLHEPTEGKVEFNGNNVHELVSQNRKRFARQVQFVFQDPSSSLDPRMTVREIIREPLEIHDVGATDHQNERVEELIELVGLSIPQLNRYPADFSGGQRQRISIARALALNPELLILDEPTSALDVSIQAKFLKLLEKIQSEYEITIVFISHDLSVIKYICDRVIVMYLGHMVEVGPTNEIFSNPTHPYTETLIESVSDLSNNSTKQSIAKPDIPSPRDPPRGCRFHTRCSKVIQPEGINITRSAWLGVFEYKLDLQAGNRQSVLGSITENSVSYEDHTEIEKIVREEYDIPMKLSDESADKSLTNSIEALAAGDLDKAYSIMETTFSSPCERSEPPQISVNPSHKVMCLLEENS